MLVGLRLGLAQAMADILVVFYFLQAVTLCGGILMFLEYAPRLEIRLALVTALLLLGGMARDIRLLSVYLEDRHSNALSGSGYLFALLKASASHLNNVLETYNIVLGSVVSVVKKSQERFSLE
ncbi:hypothetical protein Tco_0417237 [Tanacetum coccineum]